MLLRTTSIPVAILSILFLTRGASAQDASSTPGLQTCTLLGCNDAFLAALHFKGNRIPTELPDILVTAEGRQWSCTEPSDALRRHEDVVCGDDSYTVTVQIQRNSRCYQSGECEDLEGEELDVVFVGAPTDITVTLRRSGKILAERHFAPRYLELIPNGPKCPPKCLQGRSDWMLSDL